MYLFLYESTSSIAVYRRNGTQHELYQWCLPSDLFLCNFNPFTTSCAIIFLVVVWPVLTCAYLQDDNNGHLPPWVLSLFLTYEHPSNFETLRFNLRVCYILYFQNSDICFNIYSISFIWEFVAVSLSHSRRKYLLFYSVSLY